MNVKDFIKKKLEGQRISMVTCYDYSFAKLLSKSEVDCLLVGDSLAMVMHGHPTTLTATLEMMCLHTKSVAQGASGKFIVADMPFLSFRKGLKYGTSAAGLLMQAGAHAVKLEGAAGNLGLVKHLTESGIPVMGHLGLTPQSIHALGGFKVQAKLQEEQQRLLADAKALEEAGCFALVLECVPTEFAGEVTGALKIPTIGIGAGPKTDGQVLVLQDLLGMNSEFQPKFVRKFLNGEDLILEALNRFSAEVKNKSFPTTRESY